MIKNYDGTCSVNLVTSAAFAVTDPKLLTVDFAEIDKKQKERRAFLDKANPSPEERQPAQVELHKLRHHLFNLKQTVESTETYTNNIAGTVELLEQRLDKALTEKKRQTEAGNVRAERGCERIIGQLESELADAKKEYERAKRQSVNATRALRAFGDPMIELTEETVVAGQKKTIQRFISGHERIAELKAQIEKPLPVK